MGKAARVLPDDPLVHRVLEGIMDRPTFTPRADWDEQAHCAGMTYIERDRTFFSDRPGGTPYKDAKNLCRQCPVAVDCCLFMLQYKEQDGFGGGMSSGVRRLIKKDLDIPSKPTILPSPDEERAAADSTHCRKGHLRTEENTWYEFDPRSGNETKRCGDCRKARIQRRGDKLEEVNGSRSHKNPLRAA